MDANLISVYVNVDGETYRIGYGKLDKLQAGTFTVDKATVKKMEADAADRTRQKDLAEAGINPAGE